MYPCREHLPGFGYVLFLFRGWKTDASSPVLAASAGILAGIAGSGFSGVGASQEDACDSSDAVFICWSYAAFGAGYACGWYRVAVSIQQ